MIIDGFVMVVVFLERKRERKWDERGNIYFFPLRKKKIWYIFLFWGRGEKKKKEKMGKVKKKKSYRLSVSKIIINIIGEK